MLSATPDLPGDGDGGDTLNYSYDGDGKRVRAAWSDAILGETRYQWDVSYPHAELALERDGDGLDLRRYLHGLDLISMVETAGSSYFHRDAIGSIAATTSPSGGTQRTYDYEPFGTIRSETTTSGAPFNSIKFAGELRDEDTALYHLRARQYDPGVGRFLQVDPLAAPLAAPGEATYAYARNRPTALTDPSGLGAVRPNDAAGGLAGGAAAGGAAGRAGASMMARIPSTRATSGSTSGCVVKVTFSYGVFNTCNPPIEYVLGMGARKQMEASAGPTVSSRSGLLQMIACMYAQNSILAGLGTGLLIGGIAFGGWGIAMMLGFGPFTAGVSAIELAHAGLTMIANGALFTGGGVAALYAAYQRC